jgi:hypothetical protein
MTADCDDSDSGPGAAQGRDQGRPEDVSAAVFALWSVKVLLLNA